MWISTCPPRRLPATERAVTLLRVDGVDPMAGRSHFSTASESAAPLARELPLTVRSDGVARDVVVACTVAVEDPYPDLHVARALPLSPPARSSP